MSGLIQTDNTKGNPQGARIYECCGSSQTLSGAAGGQGAKTGLYQMTKSRIRRLTPTECERLQGFPDGWTSEGVNDAGDVVKTSDSQRYKMVGNAVTSDIVEMIARAVKQNLQE